jgi:hypothetical protein
MPWRPIRMRNVEAHGPLTDDADVSSNAPVALYSQEHSSYSFPLEAEAIVRLERLEIEKKKKNPVTSLGLEPETVRLVA